MKRMAALVCLLVCFSGCDKTPGEVERGMALRSAILQGAGCRFGAEITADYGDKVYAFSMDCEFDQQGNLNFTVTEPESIAGIRGSVSQEGGKLTFADTALCFETLVDDQVTPVTAPWVLMKTLRSGYLTSAGMEGERLRLSMDDSYEEDALRLDIWVSEEDKPLRGEILYRGRRILSVDVTNFEIL